MYATATACDVPPARVARHWIPGGPLGIELTIYHMRRVVRESLSDPLLLATAGAIVGPSVSPSGAARGIRAWLDARVRFLPDPLGVELLRSPALLIQTIQCEGVASGDCDDVAILGAALGLAVGLPARFVLYAFEDFGLYEHVFTELETEDGWLELDTTRPDQLPADLRVARTGIRRV